MHLEFLEIDDPAWPKVLGRLRHDLYHRPAYVRLEARRMDAQAEAVVIRDRDRLFFVPYLIRPCDPLFQHATIETFDVVSPYGYPGMLLNEAGRDADFARNAIDAMRDEFTRRGVCSAFFRMHPLLGDDFQSIFPEATFCDQGETVAIDLTQDEDRLWKQIRQGHRETIKKGYKLGFAPRFVPLVDVLDEFLNVYEQTMSRVKANESYYFGRDYFAELAEFEHVHCCIVEKDSRIAAACIFFETDGIVQAHLGGTHTAFLPNSPFHLTLHHAALWGKRRGNRWLHLGGGVGSSQDSLLHFKCGFSPTRFRFLTARLIIDEAIYNTLVDLRAREENVEVDRLLSSEFFPAYRACC